MGNLYQSKSPQSKSTHSLPLVPIHVPVFLVFYSEPYEYHPLHAVVLLMHPMHGENELSQVCVDLFLWRQKQESNRWSMSEDRQNSCVMIECCRVLTCTQMYSDVLRCTQNVLCFSTEGYEKPWSLNSMSGMSGDASGVSSVSALPCSPPCLMQHSHSPIPSIM